MDNELLNKLNNATDILIKNPSFWVKINKAIEQSYKENDKIEESYHVSDDLLNKQFNI